MKEFGANKRRVVDCRNVVNLLLVTISFQVDT